MGREFKNLPTFLTRNLMLRFLILENRKNLRVILKGVAKDFDAERFQNFMVAGEVPKFNEEGYNNKLFFLIKLPMICI